MQVFFSHTCSTIHILHALPYMFYHTCFQRLQIGIATIRGSNYPLADMNVFVTDLIVDNVMTHVQRFSSGILII